MPLRQLRVFGYRSLRDLTLPLGQVTLVTGANGTGKSNLYQALVLTARAAQGQFARAVAEEGGTPSVLWAGGERIRLRRKAPPQRFGVAIATDTFDFHLAAGLPSPNSLPFGRALFRYDPEIKEEKLTLRGQRKPVVLMERNGPSAWIRNGNGVMDEYAMSLLKYESVLPQIVEPQRYPEVYQVRQTILAWRFYHQFRTDAQSPLRSPQIGVHTSVLSQDGSDLAAALETILEIGDEARLNEAVAQAFRGASLIIEAEETLFRIQLQTPGLVRPLDARELSDGQLRFLCLCAALLSPRPPALLALNEPETSLHPDLYTPLAKLIVDASRFSQIWITTHAPALAEQIAGLAQVEPVELTLVEGETRLAGERNTPRRPHQVLRFEDDDEE